MSIILFGEEYDIYKTKSIYLYNSKISTIHKNIGRLINLKILHLDYNNIVNLPNSIGKLIKLEKFSIAQNKICKIPKSLTNLFNLTDLYFRDNKIVEIDEDVYNLINLKAFNFSYNSISEINESINKLKNLVGINLDGNKIYKFPSINNLIKLKHIYICYNNFIEIPLTIICLTELNWLCLRGNPMSLNILPEEIYRLINLIQLDLDELKIGEINCKICGLINLKNLYVSRNLIKKIPSEIGNLSSLRDFRISENLIKNLPLEIGKLINLVCFDISYNKIEKLSQTLLHLNLLKYFYYDNNPIEYIQPNLLRWLARIKNPEGKIYKDSQNVHNYHIQLTLKESIGRLVDDKPSMEIEEIFKDLFDLNQLKLIELIRSNLLDDSVHSQLNVTFKELFIAVYQRIHLNEHKNEILRILLSELEDSKDKCFTGRLTRLVNSLNGFDEDVQIKIDDNEQIGNVLTQLRKLYNNDIVTFKLKAIEHLQQLGYEIGVIELWLNNC